MRDRWDEEEDELGRGRRREPEPEPTLGEVIDGAVRKVVTAIVIAGGLIALGVYSSGGGDPSPDDQVTAADGRMYRVTTESGRVIACEGQRCWEMLDRGQDLDDGPPAGETPRQNAAAAQPQAVTAQPAPAQLPAPQNTQVPAPATK
jgi:hypothetical protein